MYFGNHAYGVEEAAQIYFGTHARSLMPWQAALLAGIVRAPTDYDPVRHPKAALRAPQRGAREHAAAEDDSKPVDYALDIEKPLLPFGPQGAAAGRDPRRRRVLHAVRRAASWSRASGVPARSAAD